MRERREEPEAPTDNNKVWHTGDRNEDGTWTERRGHFEGDTFVPDGETRTIEKDGTVRGEDAPTTSDGREIDPETGGVRDQTATEEEVSEAEEAYAETIGLSEGEMEAQRRADILAENYGRDVNFNRNRRVAMPFITGAERALERSYNLNAQTLERRMMREQARRMSAQNASKFALERADKELEYERDLEAEERAAERAREKEEREAEREGDFTLGRGQRRYDAEGNIIAEGAEEAPAAPKYEKIGDDIYRVTPQGLVKATPQEVIEQREELEETKRRRQIQKANVVINKVADALGIVEEDDSAIWRQISQFIGGTDARSLRTTAETIKARLAFDELQAMRDASPTGGALGQVSEMEIGLLESALASLDIAQDSGLLRQNLMEIAEHYRNVKNTLEGINPHDEDYRALRDDPELANFSDKEIWDALGKDTGDDQTDFSGGGSGPNNARSPLRVKLPTGVTHEGGSASWRNNNPLNIKNGQFASRYGATQGSAATDGGNFAAFPSVQEGMRAARDLLRASSYTSLPLEQAMRRWSGNGYGADVAPAHLRGKSTGEMTEAELDQLIESMRKREGWERGKVYN